MRQLKDTHTVIIDIYYRVKGRKDISKFRNKDEVVKKPITTISPEPYNITWFRYTCRKEKNKSRIYLKGMLRDN